MVTLPPNMPKYRAIEESLRERVLSGEFAPGAQFPTEPELVSHYHASRATVRQAIRELVQSGLVEVRHPHGTFVRKREQMIYSPQRESRPHPPDAPHDRFMAQIKEEDRRPSQTISVELVPAPPEIAKRLELPPGLLGEPLVARRRVRFINDEPVNTNDSHFPLDVVQNSEIMDPTDIPRGTNQVLADLGYAQVRAVDEFVCRMPTEIARLALPPGTPVIIHTVTGYTKEGRPVRCTVNVLPADRHIIVYDREWK